MGSFIRYLIDKGAKEIINNKTERRGFRCQNRVRENIRQALYVAVANKLQGDLSELEAKEILLTSNPAYITSKEHDHAEHIEELYNIIVKKTEIKDALNDVKTTYFKSVPQGHVPDDKKIVSGVTKYTEKNDDGEVVDCLKVHYTDGTQ